jgi:hypothetical protein
MIETRCAIRIFDSDISWKVVTWKSGKGNEDDSKMDLMEEDCGEHVH